VICETRNQFCLTLAASITGGAAKKQFLITFTFTERAAASLKLRIRKRIADSIGAAFLARLGPTAPKKCQPDRTWDFVGWREEAAGPSGLGPKHLALARNYHEHP
jgi:hypothetical protein